jgi:hypothetical protein
VPTPASADDTRGVPLARHEAPSHGEPAPPPTPGFGAVAHGVDDEGTLWLAVSLRGAAPLTVHGVFLVCGPTVAEACGYAEVGSVTTDGRGDADSAEIMVGLTTLEAMPVAAGERRDHLTVVDWSTNTAYVSASVAYALP